MRRLLLMLALLLALCLPATAADTFQLTVLHTNDLHGMMRPFDYDDWQGYFHGKQQNVGGMARRATLIRRIKRDTKNPVVLVDDGDVFADGPWSAKLYGVPEIEAMNAMGYDLFAVGNNEFQATGGPDAEEKMLLLMRRSRFPWLAANLTVGDTGVPVEGIHPFVVRSFGGVRVGFLGLIPDRVAEYDWIVGWKTQEAVAAAQHWVPIARKECDILIATVHLGPGTGQQLAEKVPGLDAIIGGDSHSFTPKVLLLRSASGAPVPYAQAGEKGLVLGRLDLTFSHDAAGWHLTKAEEHLLPITKALPEDPTVAALLHRYLDPAPVAQVPRPAPSLIPAVAVP